MANALPSFGDISGIDSEGSLLHEQLTIVGEIEETRQPEADETQFSVNTDFGVNTVEENGGRPVTDAGDTQETHYDPDTEPLEYPREADFDSEDVRNDITERDETLNGEDADDLDLPEDEVQDTEENDSPNNEAIEDEDAEDHGAEKLFQLPISKIKRIMQTDPDTNLLSKEALAAVAISTEHFLAMLAQQSFKLAVRSKKKRITLEHFRSTITSCAACDFLEGTLPELDI